MKKICVILGFLLILVFAGCSDAENESAVSSKAQTELLTSNNVVMTVNSMGFEGDKPYISAIIKNKSDQHTIIYGQQFLIYNGINEIKPTETLSWPAISTTLKPSEESSQIFELGDFDLKENITYRLIKQYRIEGHSDTYSVYFDFEIDRSKTAGAVLTASNAVWTHNETVVLNDTPITYFLGEDNTLYSKAFNSSNVIKEWYEICKLEEFKITKDDFKGITNGKWHLNGVSVESIIADNEVALRHIKDENGNFDYFLKQKDGSVYYVRGWAGVNGLYQIFPMDAS
ncbi:MAG: hypothetical protein IJO62_05855 [Clostridia bacterium]|nr:hypothetical protein [Clostridia bacterium]